MGSFIIRVLINGLALWVATWLLQGMDITTSATEK
ncbi:phage holin family protein, partial [Paenarthrobacter sp. CM16]